MGLKDRKGIAALFDAMLFLTVMIAVSTIVLYSLGERAGDDDEFHDYIASVHRSLLSCPLPQDAIAHQAPMGISTLCQQGQVLERGEEIEFFVQAMLEKCFPGRCCRWTVCGPGLNLQCSLNGADGEWRTSYVSTIVAGSGPSTITFALTVYQ